MKLRVLLEDPENGPPEPVLRDTSGVSISSAHQLNPSSLASMASTALPLQVVDTNATSLVTPRLSRSNHCRFAPTEADDDCTPTSCLNGGRCLRLNGDSRCVCPGGTWGHRCKLLSRTFEGNGWAWVKPLPQCLPATISLHILTKHPHALILYSGPLSKVSLQSFNTPVPMLTIQLIDGRPQVLIEGSRGPVKLQVASTLNDGKWHTLHLHVNSKTVTLIVDRCGKEWASSSSKIAQCLARASWQRPQVTDKWIGSVPLQVGGLAHPQPKSEEYGWSVTPVHLGLRGCISHLKINKEFIDLGEPAYSSSSTKGGCYPQEQACKENCGFRGQCVGGLNHARCECDLGWMGPQCSNMTTPVFLGSASFMKMTMFFAPNPQFVTVQLKMRTQGHTSGLILQMSSEQNGPFLRVQICMKRRNRYILTAATEILVTGHKVCITFVSLLSLRAIMNTGSKLFHFCIELHLNCSNYYAKGGANIINGQIYKILILMHILKLRGGVACTSIVKSEEVIQEACTDGYTIADGLWHVLNVERLGPNVVIWVDDGDGWRANDTFLSAIASTGVGGQQTLAVPKSTTQEEGEECSLIIGGIPDIQDSNVKNIQDDLKDSM
ncbi:hypothetical protein SK128_017660 [Halocaridina rubra]|uniref:Uncharacterized protein n=1 Tax=Halocaridina rubra TaxID=373956 RepID=A0AAN8XLA1_HALRR